jgi:hypothetical protein
MEKNGLPLATAALPLKEGTAGFHLLGGCVFPRSACTHWLSEGLTGIGTLNSLFRCLFVILTVVMPWRNVDGYRLKIF